AILSGYAFVMWILFFAAAFYLGLVGMCGYWEHSLRSVAGQTGVVLRASIAATTGRSIMVLVCMLICGFALHRNKPKSTHGAAGENVFLKPSHAFPYCLGEQTQFLCPIAISGRSCLAW